MNKPTNLLAAAFITLASSVGAQTATKTALANATIGNSGPTTSPWFHNAQVPGSFGSFAVSSFFFDPFADFGVSSVSGPLTAEIAYTQANASFTTDGPLEFYITFDQDVSSGIYDGLSHSGSGTGIDDSQFSDSPSTQFIGSGVFTEVSSGTIDRYTLDFSGAIATPIMNAINNFEFFSIIMTAPEGPGNSTAATTAGIENFASPEQIDLTISIIPEPSATVIVLTLFGALALRRRQA